MEQYSELNVEFCKQICKNYALASQFVCNKYNLSERELKLLMFLNGVGRYSLYTIEVQYKDIVDMTATDNSRFVKKGYVYNVRTTQTAKCYRLKGVRHHIYSLTNESIIILKELYKTLVSVDIRSSIDNKYKILNKIARNNREADAKIREAKRVLKEIKKEADDNGTYPQMPDFSQKIKIMPESWF